MSKRFRSASVALAALFAVGCGGAVDEVPAITEPTEGASQEEQIDWSKESMKRGSAPKGMTEEKVEKSIKEAPGS